MKQTCGVLLAVSLCTSVNAQDLPLNVQEWRSAIEVLQLARDKISVGGWYQVEVVEGAECLATALEKSWTELDKTLVDWDYTKLAIDRAIDAPQLHTLRISGDPLATPYWGRYYMYWNDADGRTTDDVLSAIDRAIGFARDEEQLALQMGASGDQLIEYDLHMMDTLDLSISPRYR